MLRFGYTRKLSKALILTGLFFVLQLFFPLIYKKLQAQVYMTISGKVFDKNTSHPVAEAYVTIHQVDSGSVTDEFDLAKTNSDGGYIFDQVHPGEYWMYVIPPIDSGYGTDMRLSAETTKVGQIENVHQDFALEKSSSIAGVIFGQDRITRVENTVVAIVSPSTVQFTRTNGSGDFSFSELVPSAPYIILAFPPGFSTIIADIDSIPAGQPETNVNFYLNPTSGSSFSGKITSQDGNAIPNALVGFSSPETATIGTTRTDEAGNYRIEGIIPGDYVGWVVVDEFSSAEVESINIISNQEKVVNFTLQPLPVESGSLRNKSTTKSFAMNFMDFNLKDFTIKNQSLFASESFAQVPPPNKSCTGDACCRKNQTEHCISKCENENFPGYCDYWKFVCKVVNKTLKPKVPIIGFGTICSWMERQCRSSIRTLLRLPCTLWAKEYCGMKFNELPLPPLFCDELIKKSNF